jgi:hypothetical protein
MEREQADVEYQVERQNWGVRAETLLSALKGV